MSIEIVVFVFGGLLLFVGGVGAGFEAKELKIPKVGAVVRVIAAVVACYSFARESARQMEKNTNPPGSDIVQASPTGLVDFTLTDQLGDGQNVVSTTGGGVMGPGKGFGEGLSGVYFGTGRRYALTAGSGLQGMNDVRIIVVLPDGKWRENLPGRGLETDIAADRRDFGDSWGVWTASGGVVTATTQNDEVILDAQRWTKLSPIDGLRTDGVFAREDVLGQWGASPEPELMLRVDGTFEDRSGLLNMVGTTMDFDGVPKHLSEQQEAFVLRPGGGTYEFRNFTLVLRFRDERVRRINVYALPNDNLKRPKRLVLGSYFLVRK
ncbi:MAG: hypothetical protein DMG72_20645 [Acidobacteria bacterium]|nr:MAG: hypothetical protein DMG72_20645 [Acidobacteriota bacterium]